MRHRNHILVVLLLFHLGSGLSWGQSCSSCLELELYLEEPTILSYGILVGSAEFRNIGATPCTFGGSLSPRKGDFYYEVESPGGEISKITKMSPLYDAMSVQHATIPPGESFFHPVCLLKDENRFLFTTEGLHRIRACYIRPPTVKIREHPNEENSQRTVVPGTGCVFRPKRPLIPADSGHPVRPNPASDSGPKRPPPSRSARVSISSSW